MRYRTFVIRPYSLYFHHFPDKESLWFGIDAVRACQHLYREEAAKRPSLDQAIEDLRAYFKHLPCDGPTETRDPRRMMEDARTWGDDVLWACETVMNTHEELQNYPPCRIACERFRAWVFAAKGDYEDRNYEEWMYRLIKKLRNSDLGKMKHKYDIGIYKSWYTKFRGGN